MTAIEANGQTIIGPKPALFLAPAGAPERARVFGLFVDQPPHLNEFGMRTRLLLVCVIAPKTGALEGTHHHLHTFHHN